MLTASELKALLKTHGIRLTKRLGQHHLIDRRLIGRIVDRCELTGGDTVVEIGAGLGALTEPLAALAARVLAVEVDRKIAELLARRLGDLPQVTVLRQDILEFSWDRMKPAVVVGAIPYHVTSPILVWLFQHRHRILRAILILQREVGQRLLAVPGSKHYGRLSVLGQFGWIISPVCEVPRSAFFPQPEVDSLCLRLAPRARPPVDVHDEERFFEVVKSAFAHRRKTLVNCLNREVGRLSKAEAEAVVRRLGLPRSVRGETLTLEQFARLANALA